MAIIITKEFGGMTDIYKLWKSGTINIDEALVKLKIEHQRIADLVNKRKDSEIYRVDTENHESRRKYMVFSWEKIKFFDNMYENYREEIISNLEIAKIPSDLPLEPVLEEIITYKESPIRRWNDGKFKCTSLAKLIDMYDHKSPQNPITPSIIQDYVIKSDGKPYQYKNILKEITINGVPRK
jgi:hypothetical protein